jgi:hypothetical protein
MIVMNEVPISYAANVTEMVNVSTHSNNHFPNITIHNFFFLVSYVANKCGIIEYIKPKKV